MSTDLTEHEHRFRSGVFGVFGSDPIEEPILDDRAAEALETRRRELGGLCVFVCKRVGKRLDGQCRIRLRNPTENPRRVPPMSELLALGEDLVR